MSEKAYKIGSEEGSAFAVARLGLEAQANVGDEVSLELDSDEQERALLAAGWLEAIAKKGKEA